MNANVKTFTSENWDGEVLKSTNPVLVDFWASWCNPCRMIAPIVDSIADKYVGKVTVGKLNVDEYPAISGDYGVRGIPTLLLFKNGQVAEQIVGVHPKEHLTKILDKHI